MEKLIEFINSGDDEKFLSIVKCSPNEAKILRWLSKNYIDGTAQSSVYDALITIFGTQEYKFLTHLADIKDLLESGWITQGFSIFKAQSSQDGLLSLLHSEISLSPMFLKILESGSVKLAMPQIAPYEEHLEYLKDQFVRIEL